MLFSVCNIFMNIYNLTYIYRNTNDTTKMWIAVWISILSYTLMDMSHGDFVIPTRSLVNDFAITKHDISYGNDKFTFYQAIGRCGGYLIVSINWKNMFKNAKMTRLIDLLNALGLYHHISICFTISIFILWTIMLFVIISTPNQNNRMLCLSPKSRQTIKQFQSNYVYSNKMLITPSGRVVIMNPTGMFVNSLNNSSFNLNISDKNTSNSSIDTTLSSSDTWLEEFKLPFDNNDIQYIESKLQKHNSSARNIYDNVYVIHDKSPKLPSISLKKRNKRIKNNSKTFRIPFHFRLLWCIQFVGWLNFATFSLYFTSFIAVDMYEGNPSDSNIYSDAHIRFEIGIRSATLILFINAVIAALSGKFVIPYLNKQFGVKKTYFIGELCLNILLLILYFVKLLPKYSQNYLDSLNNQNLSPLIILEKLVNQSRTLYVCFIVWIYGIFIQVHYNNVFIIIENDVRTLSYLNEKNRAQIISIFNLTILFANVLIALIGGEIISLFNNQFIYGISIVSGFALIVDIILYIIFYIFGYKYMLDTHNNNELLNINNNNNSNKYNTF